MTGLHAAPISYYSVGHERLPFYFLHLPDRVHGRV
jgi:hypothetical protein